MQIKHITLERWKCLSGTIELDKLNLVIGPNGCGKTALIDAISYAITGSSVMGDRVEATSQLCLGGCGGVGVTLADGFSWDRRITRDGATGSARMLINVSGIESEKVSELDAAVKARVGNFAPMHNLGAFLDLSKEKRRKFALDLCGRAVSGQIDPQSVITLIEIECLSELCGRGTVELLNRQHFPCTPEQLLAFINKELCSELGASVQHALKSCLGKIIPEVSQDLSRSISSADTKAQNLVNTTRADHVSATKAIERLSTRRAELSPVADTAEELAAEVTKAEESAKLANTELDQAKGRLSAKESLANTLHAIRLSVTSAQSELETLQATDIQSLRDKLLEANRKLSTSEESVKASASNVADAKDLRDLLHRSEITQREIELRIHNRVLLQQKEHARITELEKSREFAGLRDDAAMVSSRLSYLCPETSDESRSSGHELMAEMLEPMSRIRDYVDESIPAFKPTDEDELRRSIARCEDIDAANKTDKEDLKKREPGLQELGVQVAQANTAEAVHTAALSATHEADRGVNSLLAKIDLDERDEKILTQKIADLGSRNITTTNELQALEEGHLTDNLPTLASKADECERILAAARAKLKTKERFQVLETELAESIADAEKLLVNHRVAKTIHDAVKAVREPLMEKLATPIVDHVNAFLEAAGVEARCYVRLETSTGKANFEIGWRTEVQRVPIEAMSGGEAALFGCGLAYGLTQLSSAPLRLLLVEIGSMDNNNVGRVLKAVGTLSGNLDNALIATHSYIGSLPELRDNGWKTIQLG